MGSRPSTPSQQLSSLLPPTAIPQSLRSHQQPRRHPPSPPQRRALSPAPSCARCRRGGGGHGGGSVPSLRALHRRAQGQRGGPERRQRVQRQSERALERQSERGVERREQGQEFRPVDRSRLVQPQTETDRRQSQRRRVRPQRRFGIVPDSPEEDVSTLPHEGAHQTHFRKGERGRPRGQEGHGGRELSNRKAAGGREARWRGGQ
mmetsp:Transcript_3185/g.7061  ORF Transcript_3185/g.7061 Transcript_3185/m.7061 type:complete len:205 (+) Transcript_3185:28-642(+)